MLGIGGNTIEEAQRNLSAEEYFAWVAYRNKRGPLNISQRIDRIGALISVVHAGGKMEDYMPWSKDDRDDGPKLLLDEQHIKALDPNLRVETNRVVKTRIPKNKLVQSNEGTKIKGPKKTDTKNNSERFIKR